MHARSRSRRRPRGDGTRGPRTSGAACCCGRIACVVDALSCSCLILLGLLAASGLGARALWLMMQLGVVGSLTSMGCSLAIYTFTITTNVSSVYVTAHRLLYGGESDEVIKFTPADPLTLTFSFFSGSTRC